MPEWAPGVLEGLLGDIGVAGPVSLRAGLLKIAAAIEAKTKAELGRSSHRAGTPSPAGRGAPPSRVTGTLARSITHQQITPGTVRVGTAAGVFPGGKGKTASSLYGMYQETLPRFSHPFLVPSYLSVIKDEAVAIWLESFSTWPKL